MSMRRWPADDLADDAWHRFLGEAIGGLREAARRVREPASTERRPGWFGKSNKAFKGAKLPDETSISQALIEAMEEIRDEQFIVAPSRGSSIPNLTGMDFHVEVARRYDPAIGPRAQPTDIQLAIHRDRLDLRLEAKKLTRLGDIAADYLGADGLGRFDDACAPYTLERFGGMLAYVTDRDAAEWTLLISEGIRAALPSDRVKTTLLLGDEIITTTHLRDVDIAVHGIQGRFSTDVVHLVFEFDAWPNRRIASSNDRIDDRRTKEAQPEG
jgi:hypothetical protein